MKDRIKPIVAATAVLLSIAGVISWVYAGLDVDFNPNLAPIGYVGQPAVSNHILYTGNAGNTVNASSTRLYAIDYDSSEWSGNLHSYPLTSTGTVVKADDWTGGAAAKIDVQKPTTNDPVPTGRYVVTHNGTAGAIFRWAGLTVAQRIAIDPTVDSNNSGKTSKVLDYIRGHRGEEGDSGDKFRRRGSVLGDMIHSTPVFCPGTAQTGVATCGADTVFVGANDGMLHAFNAATGTERFGYVPSMLIPRLPELKALDYTHKYYVDGRMVLARVGSTTILAGALGAGGRGLYALNVTNAVATTEADAAAKVLWEITNATTAGCSGGAQCFANLGYTYGQPVAVKLNDGTTTGLIVNNGYGNASGRAALFIINMSTGALIQEIVLPDGGTAADRNGLSSPTVITDTNGLASYAFAGDLNGNMWKIQLHSPYTATLLHTTSPTQAITMAPGLFEHPDGGYIVNFVTGRMLMPDDEDPIGAMNVRHYAYGIWDSAGANTALLDQTLTERVYTNGSTVIRVRTATNNQPNWSTHKGWKTELPIDSERVVGDGAFVTGSVFMFMSTNPAILATPPTPDGENWWMQLNALTGGDNGTIRFDLDSTGTFTAADQITVAGATMSPVGRNMGGGRRSQLTALDAGTFNAYQSNYDKNLDEIHITNTVSDPGIPGGHFDVDIYYYKAGTAVTQDTPYGNVEPNTLPICAKTTNVNNEFEEVSPTYCSSTYGVPATYTYMSSLTVGATCGTKKAGTKHHTIGCQRYSTATLGGTYANFKHTHQYDDKYDVTGVNFLNASDPLYNLNNAITANSIQFKVLVMNQFLNPAVMLTIGPNATLATAVNVKTYNNLASQTNPSTLLAGLPTYTRDHIDNFIFNLPLNAFISKDWWGTGGDGVARAGLIPTATGCVKSVSSTGVPGTPGPNGERANGALTFQMIKSTTPADAIEINHSGNDVRYGWRVKAAVFTQYVLSEYTVFWHHGACYGQSNWIPNPPTDNSAAGGGTPNRAPGSGDPIGGINGLGGTPQAGSPNEASTTVVGQSTDSNGNVTTNYSDGTVAIDYVDGSTKVTLSDGTVMWRMPGIDTGGVVNTSGIINLGGVTTPPELLGRINWREVRK